jgi:hypothetical protein
MDFNKAFENIKGIFGYTDEDKDAFVAIWNICANIGNELARSSGFFDCKCNPIKLGHTVRVNDKDKKRQIWKIEFMDGAFVGYNEKLDCPRAYLDVLVRNYSPIEIIGECEDAPQEIVEQNRN